MRTPVGLKISGANLATIDQIGTQIESLLPRVKGTRGVFAERTGTGYFLDFEWNREKLAHYGLSIEEAQLAVENAIGGLYMLLYLDLVYEDARAPRPHAERRRPRRSDCSGRRQTPAPQIHDLRHHVHRPVADHVEYRDGLRRHEAASPAPMVGGIFASFVLELLVYPAIYAVWRQSALRHNLETKATVKAEYADHRNNFITLQRQQSSDRMPL